MKWSDAANLGWNTALKHKHLSDNFVYQYFKTPTKSNDVEFDREAFFKYLLVMCGDFELICNNISEVCLKLDGFTRAHIDSWQKMFNALTADYNPIENYNRYDEGTTGNKLNATSNEKIAGFDSGELVENTEINNSSDNQLEQNLHSYGNIGVMSSQDLVKQELEIRQNTIYDLIIDDFKQFMCILVY